MDENNVAGERMIFSPEYVNVLRRLETKLKHARDLSLVTLFGADAMTINVVAKVKEYVEDNNAIHIVDVYGGYYVDKNIDDYKVEEFQEEKFSGGTVIIASGEDNFAREVIAEHFAQGRAKVINPFQPIRNFETDNLVYNQYAERRQTEDMTEAQWLKNVANHPNKGVISNLVDVLTKYKPLFHHVEIETVNRCNGKCSFCPVNVFNDSRPHMTMNESLFRKIIDDLSSLNYDGRLALFSNGEPLLDPDIIERHRYAREKLPNAYMRLYTNGTLLTTEKFCGLMKYLDELIIDNYNQDLTLNPASKEIVDYIEENPQYKDKVTVWLRKEDEIMTSRGGDAPNRKEKFAMTDERCTLPFRQLIIRPDGKVSLCCNDPFGKMTLGDLSKQTLTEVWYGEAFNEVREKLRQGRGFLPHCKYCDTFYTG